MASTENSRRPFAAILSEWRDATRAFIHTPVDPHTVAAIRIGYAGLLLINVACWWPDLFRWYSEAGVMNLTTSRHLIDSNCLSVFQLLPTDVTTLRVVYGIFVAQIVGLLIGWKPRVQAISCYIWLVSFQHRNPLLFEGEDTLFRIFGFLLIFLPLDAACSVDGLLQRRTRSGIPASIVDGWPIRVLQLEMTLIYFSAAWCKLLGPAWRDGTALYYVTRLDEYWGRFPIPAFVTQTPWVIRGLTWTTMGLEFAIPILIWFAPTRRIALGLVLAFHLACDYTMHLFLFHWIMLVGWMAFVTPDDVACLKGQFTRSRP